MTEAVAPIVLVAVTFSIALVIAATGAGDAFAIDSTLPPTITSPDEFEWTKSPVAVDFTLAEDAAPGSVQLVFTYKEPLDVAHVGFIGSMYTLTLTATSGGAHSVSFDPASPASAAGISAGPSLPDGVYDIDLSMQDAALNPVAQSPTVSSVRIDTATGALDIAKPSASSGVVSMSGAKTITPGTYTVTITYQDAAGNASSASSGVAKIVPHQPKLAGVVWSRAVLKAGAIRTTATVRPQSGRVVFRAELASSVVPGTCTTRGSGMARRTRCVVVTPKGASGRIVLDALRKDGHVRAESTHAVRATSA